MFSFIWHWFKQNHNNVIKFFRGFLLAFVCLVLGVVIFSEIYGVPEAKTQEWLSGINAFVFIISVAVLLMLFVSYLSPSEPQGDEYIISGNTVRTSAGFLKSGEICFWAISFC